MLGIQNALVGYNSSTFQDVDEWSVNGNPTILKAPNQSIIIPYRKKVGDDSEITQTIEDSGDRLREALLPFARGNNPMVSVQMNNSGNVFNNTTEVHMPYKLSDNFRPPIQRQQDLLPLSRLPRANTEAFTKIKFQKADSQDHNIPEKIPLLSVEASTAPIPKSFKHHQVQNVQLVQQNARMSDVEKNYKTKAPIERENPHVTNLVQVQQYEQSNNKKWVKLHTLDHNASYVSKNDEPIKTQMRTNLSYNLPNVVQPYNVPIQNKIAIPLQTDLKLPTRSLIKLPNVNLSCQRQRPKFIAQNKRNLPNVSVDIQPFVRTVSKLATSQETSKNTSRIRNTQEINHTTRIKDRPLSNFSFTNR